MPALTVQERIKVCTHQPRSYDQAGKRNDTKLMPLCVKKNACSQFVKTKRFGHAYGYNSTCSCEACGTRRLYSKCT